MELKFHHIAQNVDCIDSAIAWCVRRLNAKVLNQKHDWASVLVGGAVLSFVKKESHPSHIAFEIDSLSAFPCHASDIKKHRDGSFYYYEEAPYGFTIEWIYWPKRCDEA